MILRQNLPVRSSGSRYSFLRRHTLEKQHKRLLLETCAVYAGAEAALWGLNAVDRVVEDPDCLILSSGVIAVFLGVPLLILVYRKRDFGEYGLEGFSLIKSILIGLAASCAVLPVFAGLYIAAHSFIPGLKLADFSFLLQKYGWAGVLKGVGRTALIHIVFVGVTEEVFYRCYIQSNLNTVFAKRWRVFRVEVGPALGITAVLFGLVHIIRWGSPWGILVVGPGLAFGFLREYSGGFAASAVFHGLCNTVLFTLTGKIF